MAIAILGIIITSNAQTRTINNITYEKIGDEWYSVYNGHQYKLDNVIVTVKFANNVNESQKNSIIQANNCNIVRSNSLGYYDLKISNNSFALDVVENFLANSSVTVAEPNTIGEYLSYPNDSLYGEQWHLQDEDSVWGIDAYKAWDKENGNSNVVVAVLDNGVDILHEDLVGNIWVNPGEDLDGDGVVWDADDMNGKDDDGDGLIDDLSGWDFVNDTNYLPPYQGWHGTFNSGIIGAETNNQQGVAGIAGGWTVTDPGCKLLVGALGTYHPQSGILDDAILYAAQHGAKVITMSLSMTPSQAIADAIDTAYIKYGCFVNCSAGNNNASSLNFPANAQHCFAVGASDTLGYKANFSNYGDGLKVVAPGVKIKNIKRFNTYSGTMGESGTSFSSPQVAATAALIASYHPDFSPKDITEAICLTAMKMRPQTTYVYTNGYEYGSWNNKVGYGKLNVDRALGIKEDINADLTLKQGNYICDEVHVTNNSTLTLNDTSRFYLLKPSKLVVDAGANLVIGDNVTFIAKAGNDTINIYGNVQIGKNVSFISENGSSLAINIYNNSINDTIVKGSFLNTKLNASCGYLKLDSCNFTGGGFSYTNGNLEIVYTDFNNSGVKITNATVSNKYAYINHCTFHNYTGNSLYVDNYPIYKIENSTVTNNGGDGIDIYNSGFNSTGANLVSGNTITYNGTNPLLPVGSGIKIYNSVAEIHNNIEISHNPYGIINLNNSQVSIKGNENATHCSGTQQIKDNNTNQVYATVNSFPYYFQRNAIVDEDNSTPLVYYNSALVMTPLNVQNNYWGANFTPATDLYPANGYTYRPIWTLLPDKKEVDVAEQEYNTANQKIEQGDYAGAKSILKQMPVDYSNSIYAQAAMKRLFELESSAGNDYAGLKTYYHTIYQNQDSTSLPKLADFLGNFCEIKQQNWPAAISWFEDKIANPESLEDSVFSIIDLGYTYFLMENSGLKSGYTGMYPQYKFTSVKDFEVNRDSLIALLFKTHTNGNNKLNDGTVADQSKVILMQNTPNPFTKSTVINYKLMEAAMVKITVYNQLGKQERVIENAYKDKGVYQTEFNASGLSSGIYYYTIEINGKPCASKKMSILK